MSHCISEFSVSHPLASHRVSSYPSCCKITRLVVPVSGKNGRTRIVAMAADGRDSLDHMQRPNKTQPKRRSAQVAPIGLWDRFPTARTVQQMMDTMDRLMEDPFAFNNGGWASSSSSAAPMPPENGGYSRGRTPWEIREGEGEYKMRFDMPGMTREDVRVWVEEKMLVIKAEKAPKMKMKAAQNAGEEEEEEEEEEWSAKSYGRYNSRIALPENVEYEKIRAEVKDGVLYITIPKASVSGKVFDINVE